MKDSSKLEKVTGSLPSNLVAAGIAAFDGGILSSFLPVLTSSLAARRHEERVKLAFAEIKSILREQQEKIDILTDHQYKLINHATISVLSTTDNTKIGYLKNVVKNTIDDNEIRSLESEVIGRWLRDISADEIRFIVESFSYDRVEICNTQSNTKYKSVTEDSRDASIIAGLVSLGILIPSGPNMDTLGTYSFSNLVVKIISLVRNET